MTNLAIRLARHYHLIGNSPKRRRSSTPSLPKKAFDGLTRVGKGVTQTAAKLPQAFSAQVHNKPLSDDELAKLTPLALRKFVEQQGVQLDQLNLKLLKAAAKAFPGQGFGDIENPNIYVLDDPRRWIADVNFNKALAGVMGINPNKFPKEYKTDLDKILNEIDTMHKACTTNFNHMEHIDSAGYQASLTATKAYECLLLFADQNWCNEPNAWKEKIALIQECPDPVILPESPKKRRASTRGVPHSPEMAMTLAAAVSKLLAEHELVCKLEKSDLTLPDDMIEKTSTLWKELLTRENLKAGSWDKESELIEKHSDYRKFLTKVQAAIKAELATVKKQNV